MDQPPSPFEVVAGLKFATLIAGFAGGVVSLSFVAQLTRTQAVAAVITGALSAAYLTPVLTHYYSIPVALENGIGFFIGLTAMNLLPGVIALSERWRKDPKIPPKVGS